MDSPNPLLGWSVDHVWPRRFRFGLIGNQLIAHQLCNNRKGDREPTACEIIWLHAVNAQLGHALKLLPHPEPRPIIHYRDQPTGPSALSLAFQRAMGATPPAREGEGR
jgi:hypothetical protein